MSLKGLLFWLAGSLALLLSLFTLVADESTLLLILRCLSFVSLLGVGVLLLIIAKKLLTLSPPPPAA
ncbi:MAG: hypothetical protein QI197_05150 [Candidatus Korarchaeota archaeon]|nr:hypothetical protein [Candidatus Korarchaeota archaeon]